MSSTAEVQSDSHSINNNPCPICHSKGAVLLYPATLQDQLPSFGYDFTSAHMKTYQIVLCPECHHAYSWPRPSDLWRHYESVQDTAYLEHQADRLATAEKVIRQLKRCCQPPARLLDVGCATGDFLSVARQVYHVEGLELSEWAAQIAGGRGFSVHRCLLKDFRPSEPYDLITLWGVIEHFENPSAEVAQMARLLRPGGFVGLWTGDIENWLARLLGRKWWYVQGQHIQLFSRRSLCRLFADHRFEPFWIGRYPCVMTFPSIAKSLGRYPWIHALTQRILHHPLLRRGRMTLSLPGEMFALFRKIGC